MKKQIVIISCLILGTIVPYFYFYITSEYARGENLSLFILSLGYVFASFIISKIYCIAKDKNSIRDILRYWIRLSLIGFLVLPGVGGFLYVKNAISAKDRNMEESNIGFAIYSESLSNPCCKMSLKEFRKQHPNPASYGFICISSDNCFDLNTVVFKKANDGFILREEEIKKTDTINHTVGIVYFLGDSFTPNNIHFASYIVDSTNENAITLSDENIKSSSTFYERNKKVVDRFLFCLNQAIEKDTINTAKSFLKVFENIKRK